MAIHPDRGRPPTVLSLSKLRFGKAVLDKSDTTSEHQAMPLSIRGLQCQRPDVFRGITTKGRTKGLSKWISPRKSAVEKTQVWHRYEIAS